jgi:hypothetical protein
MVNKKLLVITVLIAIIAGTVFAETLQCRDGSSVEVGFYGSTIHATNTSPSSQTFDVVVLFKDKTSKSIRMTVSAATIRDGKVTGTGYATKDAGGEIADILSCKF